MFLSLGNEEETINDPYRFEIENPAFNSLTLAAWGQADLIGGIIQLKRGSMHMQRPYI